MKAFVWKRLDELTDFYHAEGGLLLIAESLDAAVTLFQSHNGRVTLPPPDFVFEAPGHTNETIVEFPDAGCC